MSLSSFINKIDCILPLFPSHFFHLMHFIYKLAEFHFCSSGLWDKVLKICHFFLVIVEEFMVFCSINREVSISNIVLEVWDVPF